MLSVNYSPEGHLAWLLVRREHKKSVLKALRRLKNRVVVLDCDEASTLVRVTFNHGLCRRRYRCLLLAPSKDVFVLHSTLRAGRQVIVAMALGRQAVREAEDRGYRVVVESSEHPPISGLSDSQALLLSQAFEEGVYDFPRKTTLRRLAEMRGVKPSSLSEALRKAERKVVARVAWIYRMLKKSGALSASPR